MSERSRIGIDVRKAADFGIGRYIERLVHGLAGLPFEDCSFHLFGGAGALEICSGAIGGDQRFSLVRQDSRPYSLGEHFSLPLVLRRNGIDLYHSTHYVLPHGPLPRAVVTSVHDLIHLLFPQYLPSRAALIYARHFLKRAAARSDAVITGSNTSRDDLLKHVPTAEALRVSVIPYGVDSRFHPAASASERESDRMVLADLGIVDPYILFVGNFKPHKNLDGVLKAFGHYQAMKPSTHSLVLVGRDLSSQKGLDGTAAKIPFPEGLITLGHQPDRLLPVLYRGADLFLFPSLYEGFGLPPLEALACGTPVLASRAGSLAEVLGDAAHYCTATDSNAMAQQISRLAGDSATSDLAARNGPAQAARYLWEETARRTLTLYRSLL